jgi:hypothetical protein
LRALLWTPDSPASGLAHEDDAKDARLLAAYTIKTTIWLLVATAAGLLISFKYSYPDLLTSPVLSFGRLRAIHVNLTFYGWASLALVGLGIWVAARSSVNVRARPASIDMINVNDAGVFFICNDDAANAVRPALSDLNLALRTRPHCAKISVVGAWMRARRASCTAW